MGRVAKLLSFVRAARNGAKVSDAKVDRGGGDTRTLDHFSDPGDDSHPLPGDYAAALPQAGTGRDSAVGYVDPFNTPVAQPGEKRSYARDPDTKLAVCEVWLQNDGTAKLSNDKGSVVAAPDGGITLTGPFATLTLSALGSIKGENGGGSFELTPAGLFLVNGAQISATGAIQTAAGKDVDTHTHPQGVDSGGDTQQNTGAPV